jgi:hypothetical protein
LASIDTKVATAANQATANASLAIIANTPKGYDPVGDKLLVGSARERFFDSFFTFDTTNDWEVVQTGPGMTVGPVAGGTVAGSTRHLPIVSGVTVNSRTVILSRSIFRSPVEARFQVSASQRIVNNALRVGFVEVDPTTGAIITDTSIVAAPLVADARNAALLDLSGVTATSGTLLTRSGGSAVDSTAAAFGTGFTTVATGTGPNWIAATTFGVSLERDRVNTRAWGMNVLTNTGGQFSTDRVIPSPTKAYKLAIIVENGATAPASSTDWRVHLVNVLDATRFDVSPRAAGTSDLSRAFPVTGSVVVSSATLAANSAVLATPAVPATPFILNSAASTNATLVLTGTSGLQALYATNTGAAVAFVKLYNKATAPVTTTDIPAMIVPVPAAVGGVPGVAELTPGFMGYRFALGLGVAITGGVADNDATAVAANQVKLILSRTA